MSKKGADTYYNRIYISGSEGGVIGSKGGGSAAFINGKWVRTKRKMGGFRPHPYVERAWMATGAMSLGLIDDGLFDMANREWKR